MDGRQPKAVGEASQRKLSGDLANGAEDGHSRRRKQQSRGSEEMGRELKVWRPEQELNTLCEVMWCHQKPQSEEGHWVFSLEDLLAAVGRRGHVETRQEGGDVWEP